MAKFIFDCEDEVLLPFLYDFSDEAGKFFAETGILKVRNNRDEGLTMTEQGKKNLKEMFRMAAKEYPKETAALLSRLWVLDDGEKVPNIASTFARVMTNKEVISFFTSLIPLVQNV